MGIFDKKADEHTPGEVAEITGLDAKTVRAHIYAGVLKAQKRGGRWYITRAALDEFIKERIKDN